MGPWHSSYPQRGQGARHGQLQQLLQSVPWDVRGSLREPLNGPRDTVPKVTQVTRPPCALQAVTGASHTHHLSWPKCLRRWTFRALPHLQPEPCQVGKSERSEQRSARDQLIQLELS